MQDVTWVLTDGKAGTRNGALGLAEAVGLPVVDKHVHSRLPWRWLPPIAWPPGVIADGSGGDSLGPPWPRLLVSAGERSVGPALEIRRRARGATFCVHIQHPRLNPRRFDLVVVSAHDRLEGPNVRPTLGALHRVTQNRLADAAAGWTGSVDDLPHPRVAVLIGGANRIYRFGADEAVRLGDGLRRAAEATGGSLLVTASRRTGTANQAILRDRLDNLPVYFWDGSGDNPYFAFLALADAFVVTSDSVNMVSEACFTGKPVHVFELPGGRGSKFGRFHQALAEARLTRPFRDALEDWRYTALDERSAIAAEIRDRLGLPNAAA